MSQLTVEIGAVLSASFTRNISSAIRGVTGLRTAVSSLNTAMLTGARASAAFAASTTRLNASMRLSVRGLRAASMATAAMNANLTSSAAGQLALARASMRATAALRAQARAAAALNSVPPPRVNPRPLPPTPGNPPGGGGGRQGGGASGLRAVGGAIAGLGAGRAGLASVMSEASFDTILRRMVATAQVPLAERDATVEGLAKLTNQLSARFTTNKSPKELAEGMAYFVSTGLELKDAVEAAKSTGIAAYAGGTTTTEMAQLGSMAMKKFQIPASELGKVYDIATRAGQDSAFELQHYARYFPKVGASAQMLGIKGMEGFTDIAAGMKYVMENNNSPAEAATSMTNLLTYLTKNTANKNFQKETGVEDDQALTNFVKKTVESGKPLISELGKFVYRATGGDMAKVNNIFKESRAGRGAGAIVQHYAEIAKNAGAYPGQSNGLSAQEQKYMAKGAGGALDSMRISFERLGVAIGTILSESGIIELFEKIAAAASNNKGFAKLVVGLGALAVTLGPLATAIELFTAFGALFASGGIFAGGAAAVAAWAGPIAVAGALIYKYWEPIKAIFLGIWDAVKDGLDQLQPVFDEIGGLFKELLAPLGLTQDEFNNWRSTAKAVAAVIVDGLVAGIRFAVGAIKQLWQWGKTAFDWLATNIPKAWGYIKPALDLMVSTLNTIIELIPGLKDGLGTLFKPFIDTLNLALPLVEKV